MPVPLDPVPPPHPALVRCLVGHDARELALPRPVAVPEAEQHRPVAQVDASSLPAGVDLHPRRPLHEVAQEHADDGGDHAVMVAGDGEHLDRRDEGPHGHALDEQVNPPGYRLLGWQGSELARSVRRGPGVGIGVEPVAPGEQDDAIRLVCCAGPVDEPSGGGDHGVVGLPPP